MHQVLGHASPEVIAHMAVDDITINRLSPTLSTIKCETCSTLKATEIVLRQLEVEDQENGIPFDCTTWDMIEIDTGFNGDRYISHFQCQQFLFNLVYTYRHKLDAPYIFRKAINTIENQYHRKVRYVRLNGETSLRNVFKMLVTDKGIKVERTALDTPAQNGGFERSRRVLITKSCTMRIKANLPTNLWPEIVKAVGYTTNRTLVQKLGWKTLFKAVKKQKPRFAHMHVYRCRAYLLDHYIPRRNKLEPQVHIRYLVGYDSTNIYRI